MLCILTAVVSDAEVSFNAVGYLVFVDLNDNMFC